MGSIRIPIPQFLLNNFEFYFFLFNIYYKFNFYHIMKKNTYEQFDVDDNIKVKTSNSFNKIHYIIICILSIIICCLSYLLFKNNLPLSNGQ